MALATTAGQLLVNEILPPALRSYARVLDKKGINELLHKVAQDYPDQYRDISFRLNKLGERVAYQSGGNSFNVQALRGTPKVELLRQQIRDEMEGIINDPSLDSKGRNTKIVSTLQKHSPVLQKLVFDEALRNNNPLARQVLSGARGNPSQLNSLIGADLLYADHRDQPVPVPILRSYSQGLSPVEYFAAAYGARKGVIDLKKGTADAGYVGKQLNQLAHREVVTALDAEEDDPSAPIRGLPVDVDDPDNEGALLAQPVAGLPRNTPLTPEVLRYLQRKKIENILIRSPMVGGPTEGGIYARDAGIREGGGLPGIGESVGNATAQGGSEPLTQAKISSKHSGGVSGQSKAIGGFDYINALLQAPKTVKGGGVHAEVDGLVDRVEEAPAGGWHVWIGGESHYVPQGRTLGVKAGQRVEAGDMLSDGVPNPMTVVQHKGHGEGRRYWMQKANEAYKDAGIKYSRRNLEIIARGLIDHVQLTDDAIDSDGVPDDIVPYQELESRYQPREGTINSPLSSAKGLYLEKPVLHYTVGTKVRPSVLGQLQKFGVDRIDVHPDPPSFKPTMIRASRTLVYDPDWMTRLYGSSLKGSLLEAAHRGRVSREDSTSFVPSLARGVDFGYKGHFQPPEPPTKLEAPAIPLAAAPGESAMRKAGEMRLWSCTCGACQHTFGHKQVDPEEGYPRGGKCPKCGNAAFGGLEKEAELRPEVPGTTSEVTAMTTTKAPAAPEAPKLPAPPKPGGLLGNRSSLASINYRDPDLVSQFRQGLPSGPSPRPTPVPPSIPAAPSAGASRAPAAPTPPVAPPPAPVPSQYIAPPAPAPTALLNPATRANAPGLQGLVQFAAAPVTKLTDMAQERFPGLRPSSYFQNPQGVGAFASELGSTAVTGGLDVGLQHAAGQAGLKVIPQLARAANPLSAANELSQATQIAQEAVGSRQEAQSAVAATEQSRQASVEQIRRSRQLLEMQNRRGELTPEDYAAGQQQIAAQTQALQREIEQQGQAEVAWESLPWYQRLMGLGDAPTETVASGNLLTDYVGRPAERVLSAVDKVNPFSYFRSTAQDQVARNERLLERAQTRQEAQAAQSALGPAQRDLQSLHRKVLLGQADPAALQAYEAALDRTATLEGAVNQERALREAYLSKPLLSRSYDWLLRPEENPNYSGT